MMDSIKELADAITATERTSIKLHTEAIAVLEVSDDLHLVIYRILQEHLTNILKHAEAREVRIMIDCLDEELIIKVSDDGKGFDTRNKKSGIGISNMVSRAESIGGRLSLNSAPGLGTVLIAHFSLK
jgi:signal transduction histidine kinase